MKMIMQTTAILETFLKGSKASVQLKPPEMDKKSVNMLSSNAGILSNVTTDGLRWTWNLE